MRVNPARAAGPWWWTRATSSSSRICSLQRDAQVPVRAGGRILEEQRKGPVVLVAEDDGPMDYEPDQWTMNHLYYKGRLHALTAR